MQSLARVGCSKMVALIRAEIVALTSKSSSYLLSGPPTPEELHLIKSFLFHFLRMHVVQLVLQILGHRAEFAMVKPHSVTLRTPINNNRRFPKIGQKPS